MWKDSETDIDLLDFDYLISMTKNIIENDELTPSSLRRNRKPNIILMY